MAHKFIIPFFLTLSFLLMQSNAGLRGEEIFKSSIDPAYEVILDNETDPAAPSVIGLRESRESGVKEFRYTAVDKDIYEGVYAFNKDQRLDFHFDLNGKGLLKITSAADPDSVFQMSNREIFHSAQIQIEPELGRAIRAFYRFMRAAQKNALGDYCMRKFQNSHMKMTAADPNMEGLDMLIEVMDMVVDKSD